MKQQNNKFHCFTKLRHVSRYFMKTVAEQNFDSVIKVCFQEVLKPFGFKKKGNNFYRQLPELGQIINVQKSSFYSKDHIRFTINTGLFIPEYWLAYFTYHNGQVPDYPKEPDCAIRQRIGRLKYNIDKWFDLDSTTNLNELRKEMTDNVLNYIIPYFEMHKTKTEVVSLLEDGEVHLTKFTKLIILGEYKELEKAQTEYDKLRSDKYISSNFKSTLLEYRDKYGLRD